ncbi:MAG: hypothetical protein ACYC0X_04875 [Pirellulaceae bacterium]
MTDGCDIVVAYTNYKDAALYFDYVVPVIEDTIRNSVAGLVAKSFDVNAALSNITHEVSTTPRILLPPHLSSDPQFSSLLIRLSVWSALSGIIEIARQHPSGGAAEALQKLNQILQVDVSQPKSLDTHLVALFDRYKLDQYPELLPADMTQLLAKLGLSPNDAENIGLSLVGAKLVDTTNVSWDQILEFRKDTRGREKLRRLRRFFTTNYEEKSQAYIEADLHQRLEEHEAVVKSWGFETIMTTIESFINMKTFTAIAGGSLAGYCSQSPVIGFVSGGALELSGLAVTLARCLHRGNQLKSHALSYILDARKALAPRQPV